MKNNAKRLLSILLAALLCVGMIVPAFATDADHDHEETVCTTDHVAANGTVVEAVDPVCGKLGYTIYKCNECGKHFVDGIVPATGAHEADLEKPVKEAVDATCTTAGNVASYECKHCGTEVDANGSEEIELPALSETLEHTIPEDAEPVKVENGIEYYECTVCGEIVPEKVYCPDDEHVWADRPSAIVPPVRNEDGTTVDGKATFSCTECGATKEVVVIWTHNCADNLIHVEAVEPDSCTAEGNLEYWYCELCGKLYEDADAKKETTADKVENNGEHSFEEKPTVIPAGCTTYGFEFYACTICGEIAKTVKIDPLGHKKPENVAGSDATCEKPGSHGDYNCTVCGEAVEGAEIPATGHKTVTVTVDATCGKYGYTFTYCTNPHCDYTAVSSVVIGGVEYDVTVEVEVEGVKTRVPVSLVPDEEGNLPVVVDVEGGYDEDAHDIKTVVINEATCTEDGLKYTFCPNCSYWTEPVKIPAKGHNFDTTKGATEVEVKVAGDCITDRVAVVKCAACDVTEEVTTKATGHDIAKAELKKVEATCDKDGYTYKVCAKCENEIVIDPIKFTEKEYYATLEEAQGFHGNHIDPESKMTVEDREGSCTVIGLYRYHCECCDRYVLVVISGTGAGHKVNNDAYTGEEELVPAKDATCLEDGYTGDFYCTVCGLNKGTVIEAKGEHTYVESEAKDATCTEDGNTAGKICSVCGDTIDSEIIPATGHTWVEGENHVFECEDCDAKCDHATKTMVNKFVANCTEYGFVHYDCEVCDFEWLQDYVAEKGHVEAEEGVTTEATCTEDGKVEFFCTVCGEVVRTEVITAEGHKNAAGETIVESCDDAVEDRFCVNCETEISKDCAEEDKEYVEVKAECGAYGYTLVICTVCGKNTVVIDESRIDDGHQWTVDEVLVAPTAEADGKAKYVCVCGAEKEDVYTYSQSLNGTGFDVTVENNIVAGSDYVVGSEVKVTVALNTSAIEAWGLKLDLIYAGATFKKAVIGETFANATGKFGTTVVNNTNAIALLATANNTAENKMQNVALEGSVVVIELYFEITKANASFTAAGEILAVDQTAIEAAGDVETIVAGKLLDINADGVVDLVDLNTVMALFTDSYTVGEGEDAELVEYLTAADANLNGAIDVEDVKAIMTAILKG